MKERLPNWPTLKKTVGRALAASVLVLLEACDQGPPQGRVARDFVNALINNDSSRAASLVSPDIRRDPAVQQYISSLATQLRGCAIDAIVVRDAPLGALVGAAEQATVAFRESCGQGDVLGQPVKFSGMLVGLDRTKGGAGDQYFVTPNILVTMPISVVSSRQQTHSEVTPTAFRVAQATPGSMKTPEATPTPVPTLRMSVINTSITDAPDEGWQSIRTQIVVENTSSNYQSFSVGNGTISTAEGLRYNYATSIREGAPGTFELPPGFRMQGWKSIWLGNKWEQKLLEFVFKVPKTTSGYQIQSRNTNVVAAGGETINPETLKYPTERPDSDFREIGTTITTRRGGKVTILEFVRDDDATREYQAGPSRYRAPDTLLYRVKVRFQNTNIGGDEQFKIKFGNLWGNDGFVYGFSSVWYKISRGLNSIASTEISTLVGPGLQKDVEAFVEVHTALSGGKLKITGDIDEIFNLRLQ